MLKGFEKASPGKIRKYSDEVYVSDKGRVSFPRKYVKGFFPDGIKDDQEVYVRADVFVNENRNQIAFKFYISLDRDRVKGAFLVREAASIELKGLLQDHGMLPKENSTFRFEEKDGLAIVDFNNKG